MRRGGCLGARGDRGRVRAACPRCRVFSTSVRQYRVTRPRDLGCGEEPLAVRWHKRQFRCRERGCPRRAFTESIAVSAVTEIPHLRGVGVR
ncbi:MAG: transposase family protein [Mycobacterium leprae]